LLAAWGRALLSRQLGGCEFFLFFGFFFGFPNFAHHCFLVGRLIFPPLFSLLSILGAVLSACPFAGREGTKILAFTPTQGCLLVTPLATATRVAALQRGTTLTHHVEAPVSQ
jgi:hypothetical protein